jgi:hypothetical protein
LPLFCYLYTNNGIASNVSCFTQSGDRFIFHLVPFYFTYHGLRQKSGIQRDYFKTGQGDRKEAEHTYENNKTFSRSSVEEI